MATDHNFRVKNGLEVGGVLIVNSSGQLQAVQAASHLHFIDNVQAKFGNSGDLKIYHDGSNSYIDEAGTGSFNIRTDGLGISFVHTGGSVNMAQMTQFGVTLNYNGSTKLTTTSAGASVTGDLSVSGDLNITGDINSVSVTDLDVVDKTITVGQGQAAGNSTGSGLVVAGANANMLWDNSDDRWEFNKDIFTSGKIDLGNNQIYSSGDNNHLHINAPTAIIGPSTTTSSNPSLGTSTYRFDGVWSSTGNFSGDLSVNTSTLFVDVSENKVGIRTTSPAAPLTIANASGGSWNDGLIIDDATGWAATVYKRSNAPKMFTGLYSGNDNYIWMSTGYNNTGTTITAPRTDAVLMARPGTDDLQIYLETHFGGNVGIGTSNPSERLHVYHTGTSTYDDIAQFDYYDTDDSALRYQVKFGPNGGTRFQSYVTGGNPDFKIIDQDLQTGRLSFQVQSNAGSKELLAVDSGGNTGIGTASPSQLLHLVMPNLAGGNTGNGLLIADDGAQLKLEIRKGTGGVNANRRIALYEDGGNFPLYLQEEGGNVGIGKFQTSQSGGNQNLTPQSLLHLMSHATGNSGTDVMLTLEAYIGDYIATPKKLAIDFKGQDSNNNTNFARIAQATVNDTDYGDNNEATSNLIFGMTSGGTFNERVIMTGGGKVGIQTLNPAQSLHIGNAGHILFERGGELRSKDTGGTEKTLVRVNGSNELEYGWSGAGPVKFMGGGSYTERMRVHTDGNVGIGNTTPDEFGIGGAFTYLAVGGTKPGIINLVDDGTNGSYLQFGTAAGLRRASIHALNGSNLSITLNSSNSGISLTERLFIKGSSGNVGIGTNNPIQKLQVVGSIYANSGDVFVDSAKKFVWGNSQQYIYSSNNGDIIFGVDNGNRVFLKGDGRIETTIKKHFRIDDVSNLGTTIRYYKIATVNKGNSGLTIKGTLANHVESFGTCKFDLAIFGREDNNGANISVNGTIDQAAPNSGVRIVKQSGTGTYINYDVYIVVPKYCHADVEATIHGNSNGTSNLIDWHGNNTYVTTAPTGAAIELDSSSLAAGHYRVIDSAISDAILDIPAAPSITSTTVVNETIELVFGQSATTGVDHYEVHSDGATGSDYSLIAIIPPEDIASSMSVVDASFDDSGTVAYRVYAVKNGVYSSPSTTTRSFSMPSLDVSNMSVVPDTNSYHIQYNLPNTRFLDHVEIYVDAEVSQSNLARSGASLIYSGSNPSFVYNISSSDMEKYHQFWVECVSV